MKGIGEEYAGVGGHDQIVVEGCQDMSALYDRIGGSYCGTRGEDPRIAALIRGALGDARSVVNVGAGTGAYEPTDREVLAIEPSETMVTRAARAATRSAARKTTRNTRGKTSASCE